jgi:hypothetical protein
MLVVALVPVVMLALLFVAAPYSTGPMGPEPQGFPARIIPAIGVVGIVLGLFWMVRIYRADPEAHASPFRSRR